MTLGAPTPYWYAGKQNGAIRAPTGAETKEGLAREGGNERAGEGRREGMGGRRKGEGMRVCPRAWVLIAYLETVPCPDSHRRTLRRGIRPFTHCSPSASNRASRGTRDSTQRCTPKHKGREQKETQNVSVTRQSKLSCSGRLGRVETRAGYRLVMH